MHKGLECSVHMKRPFIVLSSAKCEKLKLLPGFTLENISNLRSITILEMFDSISRVGQDSEVAESTKSVIAAIPAL